MKFKPQNYKTIAFYGCVAISLIIIIGFFTLYSKTNPINKTKSIQNNNTVQNDAQPTLPSNETIPSQSEQAKSGTSNVKGTEDKQIVINQNPAANTIKTVSDGLKILKSEVTSTAKFYPYQVGNTYMEIVAVKATDGSIRTALNTCQVCYDSGRGYYKQEGDYLVCQNCGNRFYIDQVEKIKGGCNPVPILEENKKDIGDSIVISKEYLETQKEYFSKWKR